MVAKVKMGSTPPEELKEAPKEVEVDPVKEIEVDEMRSTDDFEDDDSDLDYGSQVEDLDPDTALWVGGPKAGTVVEWKEKHGDIYITNVTFDKHVLWRSLKRNEYKFLVKEMENMIQNGQLTQSEAAMRQEEMTVQICALAPKYETKDFDDELAGLPAIISQQILEASGFNTLEVRQL